MEDELKNTEASIREVIDWASFTLAQLHEGQVSMKLLWNVQELAAVASSMMHTAVTEIVEFRSRGDISQPGDDDWKTMIRIQKDVDAAYARRKSALSDRIAEGVKRYVNKEN